MLSTRLCGFVVCEGEEEERKMSELFRGLQLYVQEWVRRVQVRVHSWGRQEANYENAGVKVFIGSKVASKCSDIQPGKCRESELLVRPLIQ